jgi:hypothetical protein
VILYEGINEGFRRITLRMSNKEEHCYPVKEEEEKAIKKNRACVKLQIFT